MRRSSESSKPDLRYKLVSAVTAFVLWGAWAYYLSYDKTMGATSGVTSGLAQGLASFTITLFMVRAVSWIYNKLPNTIFGVLLAAIATVSFTGSCLYIVHVLVGTQNIIPTIIFPLSVAFAFCLLTANRLKGQHLVAEE